MDDFTKQLIAPLNEPQQQAVLHREGPLLVLAGPGSGKTRVITHRAANLVHNGVQPRNILAITFTNKAAGEMRERIYKLGASGQMWIHTFHALGVRLLREFAPLAKLQPGFSIYDDSDQKSLIKEAFKIVGVNDKVLRPDAALNRISDAKNRLLTVSEFQANASFPDQIVIGQVYDVYQQLLEQRNAVDFDDLLMKTALLLQNQDHITEELNIRFKYLLIDEYQDTNRAQYIIARELSRLHNNICATGDPDQSIYAWRGADIGNILAFERDYPDATVIRLEQNYRSKGSILKSADKLIAANSQRKAKELWTENDDGEPVEVWRFNDDREEAERIAATIDEQHRQGRPYSDFAIFYRINAVSRGLEEALRHRGIAYRIARGVEFYNRKEIKDAIAYLRVLANPADEVALLRAVGTPTRGIGKTTIERLLAAAMADKCTLLEAMRRVADIPKVSKGVATKVTKFVTLLDKLAKTVKDNTIVDAIGMVIEQSGLEKLYAADDEVGGEDRLANLRELVSGATRYEQEAADNDEETSLADFLQRVSLASDQDAVDQEAGVVMLMTLHTAKGLEFPVVFVAGLEHGLLPHERAISEDGNIEEERRLCFVGMTRAMERLFLSHAEQRLIRGQITPRCASVFVTELDVPEVVEKRDFTDGLRSFRKPWTRGTEDVDFDVHEADIDSGDENTVRGGRRRWSRRGENEERVFSVDEAANVSGTGNGYRAKPREVSDSFVSWKAGMLVKHQKYGVGTIVWIKPSAAQTRASIKFVGVGEKTFILDLAPVELLER